jgi:hypothetical protein
MERCVSIITLGVGNLGRSSQFYERIGWQRSMVQSEGCSRLELVVPTAPWVRSAPSPKNRFGQNTR